MTPAARSCIPAVAVAAVVTAVVTAVLRRRRTLSAVAPELRTPRLWLPLSVGSAVEVALRRRLPARPAGPVAGVTITTCDVPGGQDVFVHEPPVRERPSAALLWVHGGGLVLGRPEGDHELCSRIARDLGILVVSARYRLAPEHPFPAALDDLVAALRWLAGSAAALGVDPARVAVGGASAGGGLAASVVQRAYDEELPVAFQLLLHPMLDDRTVLRRDLAGRGRIGWTPRSNAYGWTAYLGHRPGADEPRRYAAAARREDLTGLPPAWIGVGDLDLFRDEDVDYARRLADAGVPVRLLVEPGMYHAAELGLQATVPSMRAFQQAAFDALAEGLAVAVEPGAPA